MVATISLIKPDTLGERFVGLQQALMKGQKVCHRTIPTHPSRRKRPPKIAAQMLAYDTRGALVFGALTRCVRRIAEPIVVFK